MHIYLIADAASMQLTERLVVYLKPFFAPEVQFHIRPYEGESKSFWTWDALFAVGQQEKSSSLLPIGEHYFIFLVDGANEYNWFGAANPDASTIAFLQTSNWEDLGYKDTLYPIAYHLMALVTAMKFYGNDLTEDIFHEVSRGCMFDFTEFKEEVRYKLQAAQICPDCLSKMALQASDRLGAMDYIQRLFSLLRSVKEQLFSIDLHQYFGKLDYQLEIQEDTSLVLMVDNRSIELPISNGREKALFILLLRHEQGLSYKDFEKDMILREYLTIYFTYFVQQGSYTMLLNQAKEQIKARIFRKHLEPLVSRIRKKLQGCLVAYPEVLNALSIQYKEGALVVPMKRVKVVNRLGRSGLAS
ncbi:hypothetical protein [Mongoliitalea lutea]|uniref:Uncharacterized protein n=1 Tax=Mongoliitalea lutea TaxID=849756 RepID=A0A8J3D1I1_9BACT|nr:hypothetical protein [Mongoliitalea lutea]GHB49198.1 hypothetical protein GCM10008106_32500 [Mongoliitalea lutea]